MSETSLQSAKPGSLSTHPVSLFQAFLFWLKLGFISFGGPAGQISIMHQELVERRCWISERRFLHALKNGWLWSIAAAAFVTIFALNVPFPFIVLGAALVGVVGGRLVPDKFSIGGGPSGGAARPVMRAFVGRAWRCYWWLVPCFGCCRWPC